VREAQPAIEGEPVGEAELILGECGQETAPGALALKERVARALIRARAEARVVLLGKAVKTDARVVAAARYGE